MSANIETFKIKKSKPQIVRPDKMTWRKDFKRNGVLYLLFLPIAAFFIVFSYIPMFGIAMSFQDFRVSKGIFGSEWIGFDNFIALFTGENFGLVMRNTFVMALLNLTVGFIVPIFLALLISQVRIKWFKRTAQTISYIPYFCATVVICSLVSDFLREDGVITMFFHMFGMENENMLSNPKYFWLINTFADLWQGAGYGAIVFVAAISNINPDLNEAAAIDGAGRFRRLWSITLPTILPTIITMLTLRIGLVFVFGFDKILLLYMPKTYETADVLTTYVYRKAFGGQPDYGLATAAGLFQSVIATALLLISNRLNKMTLKSSLF